MADFRRPLCSLLWITRARFSAHYLLCRQ